MAGNSDGRACSALHDIHHSVWGCSQGISTCPNHRFLFAGYEVIASGLGMATPGAFMREVLEGVGARE